MLSLISYTKGGIIIKKNTDNKEKNKEYQELKRIVSLSRNSAAMKQLDLLFEETNWAFEPYDLVELVKSSNEQALEELVVLMSTKHAMCNHFSSLLQDIVESKISSKKGKLKETSKMIQEAIHNEFWKLPS